MKRLYDFIDKKGMNENSMWIITSDHGEGLGQHNWPRHGKTLYQEAIHVPLLFYFSNCKIRPSRIAQVTESFNIFPTILELIRIKTKKYLCNDVTAVSIVDQIENCSNTKKKCAFSERRFYEKRDVTENMPVWKINYEEGERYSIQDKDFKYIYNSILGEEFYNLRIDPHETNNIANKEYNIYQQELKKFMMKNILFLKKYKDKISEKADEKTIKKLKSLGYVR